MTEEESSSKSSGSGGMFFFCLWYIGAWIMASYSFGTDGFSFFLVPFILWGLYCFFDYIGKKI